MLAKSRLIPNCSHLPQYFNIYIFIIRIERKFNYLFLNKIYIYFLSCITKNYALEPEPEPAPEPELSLKTRLWLQEVRKRPAPAAPLHIPGKINPDLFTKDTIVTLATILEFEADSPH